MSTPNQPPWGQPGQQGPGGQPGQSPFGRPQGQPPYGPPSQGQPPYGQPPQGQPPQGQPPQGQPPYGRPPQGQPPYGQPPQGQPPYGQQGQPPYGQPQGFAAPGYGGQQRPGSYPTPPPPGGYPPQPGQSGPGGVPGGRPPTGSGSSRALLIVGAIVLALIIIGVGAAVLVNRSTQTAGDPLDPPVTGGTGGTGGGPTGGTAPPTQASSVPPPVSDKGDQAVKAYLDALAAGQASVALSLAQDQPADKTFLTDAVLAESLKRAPITDIKVTPQDNEYDTSIAATYKIGDQQVNENFSVQKQGDNYLVYQATQSVNLEFLCNRTLPMLINGVEVKTDKIDLFPGSYVFTSGNKNIAYGTGDPLLIKSPSDYSNTGDYRPTITAAGTKALVSAAKAKMNGCVKAARLRPSGCAFLNIRELPGQNIRESSIRRTIIEDPFSNAEPRLDYQDPSIAEFSVSVRWEATASGTANGRRSTFTVDNATDFTQVRARLTTDPIKVTFR